MTVRDISRRPRLMKLATFQGRTYRATGIDPDGTVTLCYDSPTPPPDSAFSRYRGLDVWVRTVRMEECDRVAQVNTGARLGPYWCQVFEIAEDGTAELIRSQATPGWEMVEPGIYRRHAHVSELRDYYESHTDLLFNYWRDRTFGSGSQVRP
ncbi:hypothetical protein [Actinophytocola sp.]|uniref:hypothetical protein n=1 Tax=Actinophytocola sp. TaxID=1872138 RepID=UPI002D7FE09C|nr:hypothetical protein [Actinophytocola sp.]HET9142716.1 hypothetical protein [Actinophytocola sp.]